ncbi:proteoglycan 4-like [Pecten maximus]|uniref:proteoglycan 4-like n=1 Tax=Pecten maximus TaxID=6579 RepID=UPI001458871B|nr:proteoglycan 4-like [Pecten maximus]
MESLSFLRLMQILLISICQVGAVSNDCKLLGDLEGYPSSKICSGGTSLGRSVLVDMYDTNDVKLSACSCKAVVQSPSGATSMSISNFQNLGPNVGCGSFVEIQKTNGEITGQCNYVTGSLTVADGDVITVNLIRQSLMSDSRYCLSLTVGNPLSKINITCSNDIATTRQPTTPTTPIPITHTPSTPDLITLKPTTHKTTTSQATTHQLTTPHHSTPQPTTPQPTTPNPTTPQPTTPQPTTPQPTIPNPTTPKPTTHQPTTPQPTTPHPTTPQPTTPHPTTPQPTTPHPTTPHPITPQPTTPHPTTPHPTTPHPTTTQPTTPHSTTPQPTTTQPTTPHPTTPQPTTPHPTTPQPTTPQPNTPQPTTPQRTTLPPSTPQHTTPQPTTSQSTTPKPTPVPHISSTVYTSSPFPTSGTTRRGDTEKKMDTHQDTLNIIIPTVVGIFVLFVLLAVLVMYCRRKKPTSDIRPPTTEYYSNPEYSRLTKPKFNFSHSGQTIGNEDMKEIILYDHPLSIDPPTDQIYPSPGKTFSGKTTQIDLVSNTCDNPLFEETAESETSTLEDGSSVVPEDKHATGSSYPSEGADTSGAEAPIYAKVNKTRDNKMTFIQMK